jgi:LemA protein
MGHERELLTRVTELRTQSMEAQEVGEKGRLEGQLSRSLANIFAVAEGYPDLKANQNFSELQTELSDLEEQIQMARRYYNGTVRNLNIQVESFPSNIVARYFNFTKAEFFEIEDEAERAVPKVAFS